MGIFLHIGSSHFGFLSICINFCQGLTCRLFHHRSKSNYHTPASSAPCHLTYTYPFCYLLTCSQSQCRLFTLHLYLINFFIFVLIPSRYSPPRLIYPSLLNYHFNYPRRLFYVFLVFVSHSWPIILLFHIHSSPFLSVWATHGIVQ